MVHLGFKSHPDANAKPHDPVTQFRLALEASQCFSRSYFPTALEDGALDGWVDINPKEFLSNQPHCISGRATSVLKGKCGQRHVACKIYSPEVQRPHEGDTLRLVHGICTEVDEAPMLKHLPKMCFSGDFEGCTTLRVRSVLGINAKGYRALRMIILEELEKLTTMEGKPFVDAWLDALTCHAFLYKHGVEHSDPSLWNVMYSTTRKCGVLTDFDLANVQWLPRIPGTDRTGTIPFMATDLLCDNYWKGLICRYYHHELESFIWILPFVFFAYKSGKRLPNQYTSSWITSNHNQCRKDKTDFLVNQLNGAVDYVQQGFKDYDEMMDDLCRVLLDRLILQGKREKDFRRALKAKSRGQEAEKIRDTSRPADINHKDSEDMWENVLQCSLSMVSI